MSRQGSRCDAAAASMRGNPVAEPRSVTPRAVTSDRPEHVAGHRVGDREGSEIRASLSDERRGVMRRVGLRIGTKRAMSGSWHARKTAGASSSRQARSANPPSVSSA